MNDTLLEINDLHVSFHTVRGVIRAVRGINIDIRQGETVALVGESGCGKSVTAHAITGLLPTPPARIERGQIHFDGRDLLQIPAKEHRALRGVRISMIFQEPMTSLNPVFKIGEQIADVFRVHHKLDARAAWNKAVELLNLVKIPEAEKRAHEYAHQLSGGMRQRAMIAMAMASPEPGLIIADEPTTALDVTIQAQILHLLSQLQKKIGVSILLITHDMGVVAQLADRATVMYAGRAVEQGSVEQIFTAPRHPYTKGLLNSLPGNQKYRDARRLEAIPGTVPDLRTLGDGCPFLNRCPHPGDRCAQEFPDAFSDGGDHLAWCWYPEGGIAAGHGAAGRKAGDKQTGGGPTGTAATTAEEHTDDV
ncbi:MAG: ABC transporter ATP-binding protein [Spirochaeta sp.]|jgi:oligopeptide/dipeptide ABC transporter ATP-binding protein|nr:ABC transporter ATP-binding protein [Spirochaeta sp.]